MASPHMTPAAEVAVHPLSPAEYAEWDALVWRSPHGTIFQTSWWLQATGRPFEILGCRTGRGELVGGMPLPRSRRGGLRLIHAPRLTPYLGPAFALDAVNGPQSLGLVRRAGEALGRSIHRYDSFSLWLGPAAPDLQGFLWAGFRIEVAYTFRFEAQTTLAQVEAGMDAAYARQIRKAERLGIRIERGDALEPFLSLMRASFARQGVRPPWEEALVGRLWRAARERDCARFYLAVTPEGDAAAGLLVVNDPRASYQLLVGGHPLLRSSGAGNLAEWHAIQDALHSGRAYDFEGSLLRGVEAHYRHWGARPMPIWELERAGTFRGALGRVLRRWGNYKQRL